MRRLPKSDISQAIKQIRRVSANIGLKLVAARLAGIRAFPSDAQVNELAVSVNELRRLAKKMAELHKAALSLAAARESLPHLEREVKKTVRRNGQISRKRPIEYGFNFDTMSVNAKGIKPPSFRSAPIGKLS